MHTCTHIRIHLDWSAPDEETDASADDWPDDDADAEASATIGTTSDFNAF